MTMLKLKELVYSPCVSNHDGQFFSSDPKQKASLEASLKQKEEACREAEGRRVEVELRLVEVKESLKKVESGPFTLGTTLDSSLQDTPTVCTLPPVPATDLHLQLMSGSTHCPLFHTRQRPAPRPLPWQHRQHRHPHHHRRHCHCRCPLVRGTTAQTRRSQSTLPRPLKTDLPPSGPPKEKFCKKPR